MLPPQRREGLRVFYFSTNASSVRVSQYRQNPRACLYFYRKGIFRYQGVMLKGEMEVLKDAASKKMLWKPGDKRFYPKGADDPDYCVLKFTAHAGRYYQDLKSESFSVGRPQY